MTIRKRLFVSNLLMILVPVCIAALIAAGCVGAVWYTVRFGSGLGFDDSEDFYQVSAGIAELTERALSAEPSGQRSELDEVTTLLDRNAVSLVVKRDGQYIHTVHLIQRMSLLSVQQHFWAVMRACRMVHAACIRI